jgi:hypothetical protein
MVDDSIGWRGRHLLMALEQQQAVTPPPPRDDDTSERGSSHVFTRTVLHCKAIMDLENCWEQVSHSGEDIRLIHRLWRIHALAIEADTSALEDLQLLGFSLTVDRVRETLAVKESLQYLHRNLEGPRQQIPYGVDMIRAREVWNQYHVRGQGVRVCIVDSGVYADHPDFSQANLQGWDSVTDFVTPWSEDLMGHGTHITGILAASDNDRGYVGVAPAVEVYFIRVFTNDGIFYGSDVVAAAEACRDNGSDFISMSLGGRGYDPVERDFFRDLYLEDGIISVASAGNTGGPELTYPAGYDSVISVAACDEDKRIPDFSTFNSFVDIAAPGTWNLYVLRSPLVLLSRLNYVRNRKTGSNIPSTYIGGDNGSGSSSEAYATLTGTSMAVPYVVGTLALMKSAFPRASADQLLYALAHSTQPLASNVNLSLVDALAAVQMLETGVNMLPSVTLSSCLVLQLTIDTDDYGEETAYRLRRLSDDTILWKGIGLESYSEYLERTCVDPNDCYEFIIRDTYGDGILEPGGLTLKYGNRIALNDGHFGEGGKLLLGGNC